MVATYLLRPNLFNDPSLWPAGKCMVRGTPLLFLNSHPCMISAANILPFSFLLERQIERRYIFQKLFLLYGVPALRQTRTPEQLIFNYSLENCKRSRILDYTRLRILTECNHTSKTRRLKIEIIQ